MLIIRPNDNLVFGETVLLSHALERKVKMYLDPGFAGMLVQVLVAIAAMGGAILFSLRKKIKGLFKKDDSSDATGSINSISMTANNNDVIDALDDDN